MVEIFMRHPEEDLWRGSHPHYKLRSLQMVIVSIRYFIDIFLRKNEEYKKVRIEGYATLVKKMHMSTLR
jgi:hypothetical protein